MALFYEGLKAVFVSFAIRLEHHGCRGKEIFTPGSNAISMPANAIVGWSYLGGTCHLSDASLT